MLKQIKKACVWSVRKFYNLIKYGVVMMLVDSVQMCFYQINLGVGFKKSEKYGAFKTVLFRVVFFQGVLVWLVGFSVLAVWATKGSFEIAKAMVEAKMTKVIVIERVIEPAKSEFPPKEELDMIEKIEEPTELEEIAEKISMLESGKGTNNNPQALHNYCTSLGKSNIYGYGGMQNKWCYDTEEKAKGVVMDWFKRKFNQGMTISQAVCHYNLGGNQNTCEYYEKFSRI